MYFLLGLFVTKYVAVYASRPRYESGGLLWPHLFRRLLVCVIAGQLTLIGVLGLMEVRELGTPRGGRERHSRGQMGDRDGCCGHGFAVWLPVCSRVRWMRICGVPKKTVAPERQLDDFGV